MTDLRRIQYPFAVAMALLLLGCQNKRQPESSASDSDSSVPYSVPLDSAIVRDSGVRMQMSSRRNLISGATESSDEGFLPSPQGMPFDPILGEGLEFLSAADADGHVGATDLVLGVVIADQARAYPLAQLSNPSREIINDVVGGQAIAATW